MIPDGEDETDHSRTCTRCKERPRWSPHHACNLCEVCGKKSVRECLAVRAWGSQAAKLRATIIETAKARLRAKVAQ